jgi:hypothetical protein
MKERPASEGRGCDEAPPALRCAGLRSVSAQVAAVLDDRAPELVWQLVLAMSRAAGGRL